VPAERQRGEHHLERLPLPDHHVLDLVRHPAMELLHALAQPPFSRVAAT
jgi:hypothetical protein